MATRGDLAGSLAGVGKEGRVVVEVRRDSATLTLDWVPFRRELGPPFEPGRLLSIRDQLGLTFAGYPLADSEGCRVGGTRAGEPVKLELPEGSYLLVFKKPGYREARLPMVIPRKGSSVTVELLKETETPETEFVLLGAIRELFKLGGKK